MTTATIENALAEEEIAEQEDAGFNAVCPLSGDMCCGAETCAPALFAVRAGIAPMMCPITMFMSMASLVAAKNLHDEEDEEDTVAQDWPGGVIPDQIRG